MMLSKADLALEDFLLVRKKIVIVQGTNSDETKILELEDFLP